MTLEQFSAAATELLPCPFCGGAATCENIGDRVDFWMAGCDNNACLTDVAAILPSRDEAITAWNTRTGQLVAVTDDAVERVARTLAPNLEGGREFDQMPKDRVQLRQWTAQGMCLINDATQDDATWLAGQAIAAMKDTQP